VSALVMVFWAEAEARAARLRARVAVGVFM
jgi:hypothetical protein